jgi:hypothetical protein
MPRESGASSIPGAKVNPNLYLYDYWIIRFREGFAKGSAR